jgi:2-C-methyl-D-erythritol 4-phosphate cytidylyltransferase
MDKRIALVIAGAGEGKRFGGKVPKPYVRLKGIPILSLTLEVFDTLSEINSIIIVTHPDWIKYCRKEIIEEFKFKKVVDIIAGGEKRQDSVRLGLEKVEADFVLIHDAVRPFVTRNFILQLIKAGLRYGAVIPALSVIDTIKRVEEGIVKNTIERENLYKIQTPQFFRLDIIKKAHYEAYKCGFYGTDDSALVERLGIQVKVIKGLSSNIKITTPDDLLYAYNLLSKRHKK